MAAQSSEAYDFDLFEPKRAGEERPRRKAKIIEIPEEKLEENRRPKHRAVSMFAAFMAFALVASIFGVFVYGQVQLTELTEELNQEQTNLSEQQSAYTDLQLKSDTRYSLGMVETYAKSKLGMNAADQNQVHTVELSSGDKTQVMQQAGSQNFFSKVWDSIRNLLS